MRNAEVRSRLGQRVRRGFGTTLFIMTCLLTLSGTAWAQGSIAGQVTDNTGGVLPGVTVEITSPVLIEGARVAVTDGQGQYSVTNLRPGTYSVTASLPGFTTSVREGIVLTASFNANVDIQLGVGAIEESVTVSGASPVVDVQSAQRQQVMTRELLENVPTGRSLWAYGQTVPGVALAAADVGGSRGTQYIGMASHGSFHSDNAHTVDGLSIKSLDADGNWTAYHNTMMFEEVSYETTGSGADTSGAGVGIRLIPKEGGNVLSGQMIASYVPGSWGSENLTDELRARGLQASGQVLRTYDYNPGVGGPIVRDRLWFFGSYRYWGSDVEHNNSFHNLDTTFRTYVPDLNTQSVDENLLKSGMGRLTLQMASQHKFSAYLDRTSKFRGGECGSNDAYENCGVRYPRIYYTSSVKYTGTLSSRLLLEAGFAMSHWTWSSGERQPFLSDLSIPRVDRTLGTAWGAPDGVDSFRKGPRNVLGGSASYVTGTHAFKAGFTFDFGTSERWSKIGRIGTVDLIQEYRSGRPESVVVYNTPIYIANRLNHDIAFYAQDAWTINRLTLSPGIRVEWLNADIRPMIAGSGRFVPAREFAKEECMPCWGPDVSPRLSVAYDLFGDARTAIKGSVGRYSRSVATGFAETYNPMRTQTDRRTWSDLNGDDVAQDNEIGPVNNPFDIVGVRTRNPDPDIERSYQWEYSAGVQHELIPRVSVSANFIRRTFHNLTWRDNLLVTQANYTELSVPNPLNPSETIPVYSIDRALLGRVNEVDRISENNRRWNNGFDFDITARIGGGSIFAGMSWDQQLRVECDTDNPNDLRFCDQSVFGMPFRNMFKMAGTYPLPYGVEVSGSLQSYAGGSQQIDNNESWLDVDYQVTRTILPALVQSSVTIPVIQPGTKYLPRLNQLDIRFGRVFEIGRLRARGQFDIYNATNSNSILSMSETFGSALDRVDQILPARVYGLSMRVDF